MLGAYLIFQSRSEKKSPRDAIQSGLLQYKQTHSLTTEEEIKVSLQLALASYMANKGKPPASLEELVPVYFDAVPIDPVTKKKFEYEIRGSTYKLGSVSSSSDAKTVTAKEDDFLNPNQMDLSEYVYDPNGKRDPFKPFTEKEELVVDEKTPPLLRYDISQFRVAAVLNDSKGGMFAMVEDSTGVGYPVRSGDAIGIHKGKVLSIQKDKIEVLETIVDAAGESRQELREIKLVSSGANANTLKNRPKTRSKK